MDKFIGVYENAFSKEYCEEVIKYFNNMENCGFTQNRMQLDGASKNLKDDESWHGHRPVECNLNYAPLMQQFNSTFWGIYKNNYEKEFSILETLGSHNNYSFKVQKTNVGGGYHVWHSEVTNRENSHRLLVWMVYLNDVEEGGETEFLYQHLRIKPKQGTLLIWPSSFTHTHRGNPPLSNEKYIITGWLEF